MKDCKLVINDEVNCKFEGLCPSTRKRMSQELEYFLPYARHTPAYKLGRWDGMKRYLDIGGRTFVNLLDRVMHIPVEEGYNVEVVDNRKPYSFDFGEIKEDSFSHILWPEGHVCENEPIMLRDHQVTAINAYLSARQGIGEISTGAGKTLITAALAHCAEKYGRTILVVPSKDLVVQTERDYKLFGLDVGVYYGDRKDHKHKHVICTWQSVEALIKNPDGEEIFEELMDDLVAVMVDECHSIKGDKLHNHLTTIFSDCPLRWALTGTVPLDEFESVQLVACIGDIITEVSAHELQEKGVLSTLDIDILQIQDYTSNFGSWANELDYLVGDEDRLTFISNEHIIPSAGEGNTLVLVNRVKTGKLLNKLIPNSVYIDGNVSSKKRKEEYDSISTSDNKVIIATFGVASTGIDIPRIFNVYLMEAGKSYIKVIQSIGRGIRKAKDKDYVKIYDVCSNAKYSKRHLTERKRYYKKCSYPHKVKKITGDFYL